MKTPNTVKILRVLAIAALVITLGVKAYAHEHEGAGQEGSFLDKKTDRLKNELSLSEEQATKVRAILQSAEPEYKKMMEKKKETHEQIKAVLTPEQLKKFEAMKKNKFSHKGNKEAMCKTHGKEGAPSAS